MIEFPRKRFVTAAAMLLGVVLVFVGAVAVRDVLPAVIVFVAIGGVVIIASAQRLVAKTPRFRATDEGVWFGGGAIVPWAAVKTVFAAAVDVQRGTTSSIAFEFHQKATVWKTPIEHWLASRFSVGDLDIALPDGSNATVLAARLDAMRVSSSSASSGALASAPPSAS